MATKIEYVDETINPIQDKIKGESGRGYHCAKCSPGCLHCYAERINDRFGNHLPFMNRNVEFMLVQSELEKPLKWNKPRRIFIQSMGDLFHNNVSHKHFLAVMSVISKCPQHTFFMLTKRVFNMVDLLAFYQKVLHFERLDIPKNLWLGVTVCNQEEADAKIPILLSITGFKKWISYEPALEPVDFQYSAFNGADSLHSLEGISWIVAGAETGPGARPANDGWFRSVRDQCKRAGVPFFMKQTTRKPIPDDLMIREFPKGV